MTFHDQLRSTFRLGSGVFLCSAMLFLVTYGIRAAGYVRASDVLFVVSLVVVVVAALTLVAGLVGRSVHRWVWFNVIARSRRTFRGRTAAQRVLASHASPVLRFWLHLDRDGKDRDGRI